MPYIPQHAASDFSKSTQHQRTNGPIPVTESVSYTPTHAASDFSKLKPKPSTANITTKQPVEATKKPITTTKKPVEQSKKTIANSKTPMSSPPTTKPIARPATSPQAASIEDGSNDYQLFLAAARAEAARTYNTTGIISPKKPSPKGISSHKPPPKELSAPQKFTIKTPPTMIPSRTSSNNIPHPTLTTTTKDRDTVVRPRTASAGQHSKPGNLFGKVGQYIRPSKPSANGENANTSPTGSVKLLSRNASIGGGLGASRRSLPRGGDRDLSARRPPVSMGRIRFRDAVKGAL